MGHCCRSRDKLINDVLLWNPSNGQAKEGRPSRTYIQQLSTDTGCSPEDLPQAMDVRDGWRERVRYIRADGLTWLWWWWMISFFSHLVFNISIILLNFCSLLFIVIDFSKKKTLLSEFISFPTHRNYEMILFNGNWIFKKFWFNIYYRNYIYIYIYIYMRTYIWIHALSHTHTHTQHTLL